MTIKWKQPCFHFSLSRGWYKASTSLPKNLGESFLSGCVEGSGEGEGGQRTGGGSAALTSQQEGVRWARSVLCQTCKYPGCHRVNRQKPAARNRGAAVAWLGAGSTVSPCAVTLTKPWCHVSLAGTWLRTACPVPRPGRGSGQQLRRQLPCLWLLSLQPQQTAWQP